MNERRIHEIKSWPEPFAAHVADELVAEHRYDGDRKFARGDLLRLQEFDPQTATYTGEQCWAHILYVQRAPAWGIRNGYCVLSLEHIDAPDRGTE